MIKMIAVGIFSYFQLCVQGMAIVFGTAILLPLVGREWLEMEEAQPDIASDFRENFVTGTVPSENSRIPLRFSREYGGCGEILVRR